MLWRVWNIENPSNQLQLSPFSSSTTSFEPVPGPSLLVRTDCNRLFNFGFRRKPSKRPASTLPTKSKKKKLHTWCHNFVCLSSIRATRPPSSLELADLIGAGLGRKQLTLFVVLSCIVRLCKLFYAYMMVEAMSYCVCLNLVKGLCRLFPHHLMVTLLLDVLCKPRCIFVLCKGIYH